MAMRNATQQGSKKIVGVLYKGGEHAAQNPGFVGWVENALGIRGWLESLGHRYVVTDDKDGPDCELEKHIGDAHVLVTTPFHPAYVGADRIGRANNLELLLTAGIGSDHSDLPAPRSRAATPCRPSAGSGTWPPSRTGPTTWRARRWAPSAPAASGGCCSSGSSPSAAPCSTTTGSASTPRWRRSSAPPSRRRSTPCCPSATSSCSTYRSPTRQSTGMFDKEKIAKMKRGVIIVNNALGAIMDTQAVADACKSGHIAGYGGDVWYPQPPPKDHPWRYMPNNAMTPHISGTTIDAQLRYAAGVKDMLERYFKGQDFPEPNYIVKEGKLASQYQ
ncbi:hypothetical protein VPH35_099793 [Triticum aestivum]